jgi:serine/threonine protein kinase
MKSEHWQALKLLFLEIGADTPEKREELVRRAADIEPDVAAFVRQLLSQDRGNGALLLGPCWGGAENDDARTPSSNATKTQTNPPDGAGSEDHHSFRPGEIVDSRFQILDFIAEGGMGEVYSALEPSLPQKVALKTIRSSIAGRSGAIERFKSEVKQSLRITHPNICRVHQLSCDRNEHGRETWFLTMELLDGITLSRFLAEHGPIPQKRAFPLIRQMVSGLAAAHHLGIVHRDLKPANIMLVNLGSADEHVKIMDFGLALSISAEEGARYDGRLSGTPAYRAPEQESGGAVGPQADLFALGLILSELLTGERLQIDRSSREQCHARVTRWLAENSKIDRRIKRVVKRCLQFLPEDRFKDAQELPAVLGADDRRLTLERAGAAAAVVVAAAFYGYVFLSRPGEWILNSEQITPGGVVSAQPSLSPDGKHLTYMSTRADPGNLDIWYQALPNGTPTRLTNNPSADKDPSLSPDGKVVAFRSERDGGGIYLIRTDGTAERLLIKGGRGPAISPDGTRIGYWLGSEESSDSGELYVSLLDGTDPRREAAGFEDARRPAWTSDGRFLIFYGCRSKPDAPKGCPDWWALDTGGTEAVPTGVIPRVRREGIEMDYPPTVTNFGNHLLFSGRLGASFGIWDVPVSAARPYAAGHPLQVKSGSADQKDPVIAENGVLATTEVTGALHLWRVRDGSDALRSRPEKLTDAVGPDCCPAMARKADLLYFTRKTGNFRQLMRIDPKSKKESIVYSSEEDKFSPLPDSEGHQVAFETRTKTIPSISLWTQSGVRRLCDGCFHPSAWTHEGGELVCMTTRGDIISLEIETKKAHVILPASSEYVVGEPDWNPVNQYLLFTILRHGTKQLFAVKLAADSHQIDDSWVSLSAKSVSLDSPHWSEDGSRFYYYSVSDGSYCIWATDFDPLSARTGKPYPIEHYHDWGKSPRRAFSYLRGLTESNHWIYTTVGEMSSTVWTGRLERDRLRTFLHDLF